jgi:hypothetical protein
MELPRIIRIRLSLSSHGSKMKPVSLLRFVLTCLFVPCLPVTNAQKSAVAIDWNAELARATAAIETNPKSAYWHSQAGVAYDALGDFGDAVKEVKLACELDESNPNNYYLLYFFYKRQLMHPEQRQVLLDALEMDPNNPLGTYEFAWILEDEKHWGILCVNIRLRSVWLRALPAQRTSTPEVMHTPLRVFGSRLTKRSTELPS